MLAALWQARKWITEHLLLFVGAFAAAVGWGWSKGWDWITWIRGFLGIPERALGMASLAFAMLMVTTGILRIDTIGPLCFFVLIWIGTIMVLISPTDEIKTHSDHYFRRHLVERLADLLLHTPENIRRIGILAEWGEGKTQVMKLLEAELRNNKTKRFRTAWVNPWRASSRDDAWIEIAKGVDQALGFPRLLPQVVLSLPGIGALLELLPKPLSGFTADLKTLLTSEGSAAEKIATGLTEFLQRRDQWLLIFVDDMERVRPEELRKVFPIVDRVVELERCYFIFAIDPKRVAKAFNETSAHGDETKGYLDKILDLQMSLPMVANGEVYEMLQHRLDHKACPRLSSILPRLKDYLPCNPRLADRFLRDADGRERMFLSRFGMEEENYEGFFLLLILEVCYPTAFERVSEEIGFFEEIVVSEMFGGGETKTKFDELVEQLASGHPPSQQEDLRNLLKRLHTLCSMFLKYDMGEKALDLHWALEGYRKLIRFTLEERNSFIEQWVNNSGRCSLEVQLKKVGDFSEPELVVRQALELELEKIRSMFQEAYRLHFEERPLAEIEADLVEHLERFIRHVAAIKTRVLPEFDRKVLSRDLFKTWIKLLASSTLRDLPQDFTTRLLAARKDLTLGWVQILEPEDRYELGHSRFMGLIRSAPPETECLLEQELDSIEEAILDEFSNEFIKLMRSQPIPDFFPPSWMKGSSISELRYPVSWLSPDPGKAEQVLTGLADETDTNDTLRDNFVWLVRRELLNAYRLVPNDGTRAQHGARSAIQANPWYLRGCWDALWRNPPTPGIAKDLVWLRDRAIVVEGAQESMKSIAGVLRELPVPEEFQSSDSEAE